MSILFTLAAFGVALGILIIVHEYGHYAVAKRCGVKVLRFSVGFGKPLYTRRIGPDRTEWSISAIPLGGYVKMLDEREGEVDPGEAHRAFNRQSVYKRCAIVLAGPLSNLLLAVLLYWILFLHGIPGMKPILGPVKPDTPVAEAGFREGEEIYSMGQRKIRTWDDVRWVIIKHAVDGGRIEVSSRNREGRLVLHELSLGKVDLDSADILSDIGFDREPLVLPPVIGEVVPDGPAARAGLLPGDPFESLDGQAVKNWSEVAAFIRTHGGIAVKAGIERKGNRLEVQVVPEIIRQNGEKSGRLGIAAHVDQASMDRLFITVHYGPFEAFSKAVDKTRETSFFTLKMLFEMVAGRVSVKNIGGPITIADYAGQSARIGPTAYLGFLALISISLGVLNLLPVPVLDGGHLMYYMAEIVRGRPLPERVMEIGQQLGMFLLFSLMALAIYNDLHRLVTG